MRIALVLIRNGTTNHHYGIREIDHNMGCRYDVQYDLKEGFDPSGMVD